MFIQGFVEGKQRPDLCRKAAEASIGFLEQVAACRDLFKAPACEIREPPKHGPAHAMWAAANLVGDRDLTPMAAVAGAIADATADFLDELGATRVVVDNGGDVAIRLAQGDALSVGIRPDVNRNDVSHKVLVTAGMNVGGVCTSGLGGRSFTRGVASAATVFAKRAAVADAAASAIANATYVHSPAVVRRRAGEIDPDTDIKTLEITESVGDLTESETSTALLQGVSRAECLVNAGVIAGACIAVKGRMSCTQEYIRLLEPVAQ
jgi:ApbE superfamily uncharacterized protein (UPF0280 family)